MINKGYIEVKRIIEEVYAQAGYKFEIPWVDCLMWVADVINLIDHPALFIPKVTGSEENPNLEVKNYRAKLPCDFHKLAQVAVNGVIARYTGNTFHHLLDGKCCGLEPNSDSGFIFKDNFGNVFSPQASAIVGGVWVSGDVTFDINNEFLTFNVKEGKACLAYYAFPVDKEGFPLVPDDTVIKEALKSYLIYRIDYIQWRNGEITDKVFLHSEQNWFYWKGKLSNHVAMPELNQMESLKNQILRLRPDIYQHSKTFRTLGESAWHRR